MKRRSLIMKAPLLRLLAGLAAPDATQFVQSVPGTVLFQVYEVR